MRPIRMGLVGMGKISIDQHVPVIAADDKFILVGGVSPHDRHTGVDVYATLAQLFEAVQVDAVAINTPPQVRFVLARDALLAGKHVLLEKPPSATVGELAALARIARETGVSLFTAWHSQHAAGVEPARVWLDGKAVSSVTLNWREDVRHWHPGQQWIWRPGGLGVFDPGINALSIVAAILPGDVAIEGARFEVPANCQTPIAAELAGRIGDFGLFSASFSFLQTGQQLWTISVETDGGLLELAMGGAELSIGGVSQTLDASSEYTSIYRRFAHLIDSGLSDVDPRPLRVAADAFLIADRITVDDFVE